MMLRLLLLLCCLALPARADSVNYEKQIKPLLAERCYSCHGALKQKSGLRIDTVASMLKGGDDGPVIVPNEPDKSSIIQRVSTTDLEDRMPPEHEGAPFDAAQIKLLRDWIAAGALAPQNEKPDSDPRDHWSFRELVRPKVPAPKNHRWVRNPIDAFIAQKHSEQNLTPQPEAPREILLRRLYIDLIGLPPSLDELDTRDYDATVRNLLNDPRHGERWARHWMDIWRYSDPYGLGEEYRNSQRHIWHWRDWIIESLNADMPYDEMVRLQLAADELHPTDLDKLRATGFLARNFYLFNRNQWLEETVEHVSKGFLGLTMNCAKCHDHKYDPLRQVDFYQMRAFFEPYQVRQDILLPELDTAKDGLPRAFDALLEAPTYRFIRGNEGQPDKSTVIPPEPPKFLSFENLKIEPIALPAEAHQPERREGILDEHLKAAQNRRDIASEAHTKSRQTLIDALRKEADALEASSTNLAAAKTLVDESRAAFNAAEAAWMFARHEATSVKRRIEAMRASWTSATNQAALTAAAISSERKTAHAKAQQTLAAAELRLLKAPVDKKEAINKEIKDAREAIEKAQKLVDTEIKPDEKFTPLPGAKWSATRFVITTADDPPVKFPAQSSGRRRALADWITDRRNPLTARVAVNHIWTRHFGAPLAPNVFDLGRKAPAPANPELLDWLACELIDSGWSMKRIHQLIVTSAAYRMSSSTAGAAANIAKDPDNKFLWRRDPIRLEAESLRDSLLALAGQLDPKMFGPTVPPGEQSDSKRRSLYFFTSHNDRNLFLMTFDGPLVRECYRREQSIVPQQALAMSNSKLAIDASAQIAARLTAQSNTDESFIRNSMRALLAIDPKPTELAACQKALSEWRKTEPDHARARLIWALLNHNDFVTLR